MGQPAAPIPGLSTAEVALHFLREVADPRAAGERLRRRFGPVAQLPAPGTRLVFLLDPELIHELLHRHHTELVKDDITLKLRRALGDGLLTAHEDKWRPHRKLVAPSFTPRQLQTYADEMAQRAERLADRLEPGLHDNVHGELLTYALEVVSACLFGADAAASATEIGAALGGLMDRFNLETRTWRRLVPERLLALGDDAYQPHVDALDRVIRGYIEAHRARPHGRDDLLIARLLAARDEEGAGLTEDELRDEAVTLFAAGAETTALALTFTLLLLAQNPAVRSSLERELDHVLGDRQPTPADLPRLPLLERVVTESMRVLPPAWGMGRRVLTDLQLGPWQLHEGDTVLILMWLLHRDPLHFPDPERFVPDRWADGLVRRLPRYAYMPFGAGPRVCVGNHFALLEIKLALAVLLRRVRFHEAPGFSLELDTSVTLRPTGPVPMRVERR